MTGRVVLAGLVLISCVGRGGVPPSPPVPVSDGRYVMGTVLEISVLGPSRSEARRVVERLFRLAEALDRQLTRHDPGSVVSRLNRRAGAGPQPVPQGVARILSDSLAYSRLTRGSFDVTVGPLVELWTRAARRGVLPTPVELARARRAVGADRVRVSTAEGTVELAAPGTSIDLGGIAKGWALDRMSEVLDAEAVPGAFVSFGGSSLLARGAPPGAPGWRVLLSDGRGDFAGVAHLRGRMLSVSGSFGRWSEIEGRRFGHVIDPRTGQALSRAAQAAVVALRGSEAEALSKALLILDGPEGLDLVESCPGAEALLVDPAGRIRTTSGWQRAVGFEVGSSAS